MFITKTSRFNVTDTTDVRMHSSTSDKAADTAADAFLVRHMAVRHHGDLLGRGGEALVGR